jgi:hypothetical protein
VVITVLPAFRVGNAKQYVYVLALEEKKIQGQIVSLHRNKQNISNNYVCNCLKFFTLYKPGIFLDK